MLLVETVRLNDLLEMSKRMSEPLVKGVVDVDTRQLVVDAGLHSDEELFMLEQGSEQEDLWGINLWPDNYGTDDLIEFDSMINIRPEQNNRSRSVENEEIRKLITEIVMEKICE